MNLQEVPQDKKDFKDGYKAPKKVLYVTNPDGSYTQTQSVGWEPENIALEQAWEDIEINLQQQKNDVINGKKSPIAYYMVANRMDIAILASYVGKWQWQVKRHLKPSVFKTLSQSMLQKYADTFGISISELKHIK